MSTDKTPAGTKQGTRPRGRPRRKEGNQKSPEISRASVIEFAFSMTKTERLDALSMVKVAAAMGVSPSLVHYYLDSRDALTSGVINRFFQEICKSTPAPSDDPHLDVKATVYANYLVMLKHPGVVDYLATHNRFRLVQQVQEDEADYGIRAFELLSAAIMRAGYSNRDAAMLGHLVRMFVLSSAQAEANFQTPAFHKAFLDNILERFPQESYPGLHHSLRDFATLDGEDVFNTGLEILLDGFERRAEVEGKK